MASLSGPSAAGVRFGSDSHPKTPPSQPAENSSPPSNTGYTHNIEGIPYTDENETIVHELGHLLCLFLLPSLQPDEISLRESSERYGHVSATYERNRVPNAHNRFINKTGSRKKPSPIQVARFEYFYKIISGLGGFAAARHLFKPQSDEALASLKRSASDDIADAFKDAARLGRSGGNKSLGLQEKAIVQAGLKAAREIMNIIPKASWQSMIQELKDRKVISSRKEVQVFLTRHLGKPEALQKQALAIARKHFNALLQTQG